MENLENILDELNDYERQKTAEIPKSLEEYILHLAKTGETLFPWPKIRGLIRRKLETVVADFRQVCPVEGLAPSPNVEPFHYETMKDKILEQFDSFTCAPFTIQRLCELLCAPRKHYKRTDKFMRGIEKNLLVVSTVDPEQSSRKRLASVTSSQTLVNGVVELNAASVLNRNATASLPVSAFGDPQQQPNQRPISAASDVASVSDADSGISDTEDEEKPAALNQNEKPVDPVQEDSEARQASSIPLEQPVSSTTTDQTSELEPVPVEQTPSSIVEEPSRIANPIEEVVDVAPSTSIEAEPSLSGSDKKRPLEREENEPADTDDHSPDAKQPRFLSPDKDVEETVEPSIVPTEPEVISATPSVEEGATTEPIPMEDSVVLPEVEADGELPTSTAVEDLPTAVIVAAPEGVSEVH